MNTVQKGFTLIELMIVIAIITILAGILIPNFLHARAEAQTASCEGNLRNLATALEEYAVDNGFYPTSFANLLAANNGAYLKVIPRDPAGGAAYALAVPATAPCTNTQPITYVITDGGNHDTTTTVNLPGKAGTPNIDYCSGTGIIGG